LLVEVQLDVTLLEPRTAHAIGRVMAMLGSVADDERTEQ
jgi:hypothetical protein